MSFELNCGHDSANRRRSLRGWRSAAITAVGIGVLAVRPAPALADPNISVQSHIGSQAASDPLSGAIVVTGLGEPVKINTFTANNRCTFSFYTEMGQSSLPLSVAGIPELVGLTDDQAPGAIEYASRLQGKITKTDLTLNAGDEILILVPALIPGAEILGYPMGGSCGNSLISLKADTDAGELDWDFSK